MLNTASFRRAKYYAITFADDVFFAPPLRKYLFSQPNYYTYNLSANVQAGRNIFYQPVKGAHFITPGTYYYMRRIEYTIRQST